MTDVTFIIPVGPAHRELADRAIESVKAQSVPCTVISIPDPDGRGPAPLRNAGLSQVKTPYVSFLDADDWIEPQFAERCLSVIRPGHYVCCDWWQDNDMHWQAPETPWDGTGEHWYLSADGKRCVYKQPQGGSVLEVPYGRSLGAFHILTTLLAADDVRRVGGFDVTLPGSEDSDFYWRLTRSGIMPIILHEPLFHYGPEGTRAHEFMKSAAYDSTMSMIVERYRHLPDPYADPPEIVNAEFPGSVLVICAWEGKQVRVGQITGIRYPKSGWGKWMWVHADDAAARPDLFRPTNEPKFANPFMPSQAQVNAVSPVPMVKAEGLDEIAALWFPETIGKQRLAQKRAEAIASVPPAVVNPDVGHIIELFDSGLN